MPRYSGLSRAAALLIAVICLATLQVARAQNNGLVAAYSFDEGTGSTVNDASGNGNTGTINGATWSTSGKYSSALVFNGSNSLIKVNDSASLDLTSGMTLEAWVYPTATVSGWRDVVYKGDSYYLEAGSPFGGAPAGGGTFTNFNQNIYGVAPLTVNTWTHLALSFDGSNLSLWVNGVQVSTKLQTSPLTTSTQQLTIGGDTLGGQYFNGRIDEVRIYNRPLSQTEIQTDMATPIGNVSDASVPNAATAEKAAADSSNLSVNAVSASSASSAPGLVQHTVNTKDLQPFSISSSSTSLPNPSVAGNCLIVTAYYSSGGTPTISDDKGNSYTPIATSSAQSGQQLKMWAAPNVAAGTVKITVGFSGGASWVSLVAAEFYNIATSSPLDTSATTIGNSSSVAAGNMTVPTGDLVYQVAAYPSFPLTSWAPMSSPAFTPLSLNQIQGLAAQYWVATSSSINPTFTVSPANSWETVAVALKPATAGGSRAGMRVVKTESFYVSNVSSAKLNFPTSGNLAVLSWVSDQDVTSVSSSPAFNWVSAVNNTAGNAGYTRIYYASNAASNSLSLSLRMSGLLAQGTAVMYDIAGAASSPLGATSVATGHQSNFGNLAAGSITPTSNGIVIPALAIESNSITGVAAPAGAVIDPQGNAQGTYGLDGWGHYYNSNTSPVTFTWTTNQQQFPGGVANWEVSVAAFKSTGGSDTTAPTAPTNLTAAASGSTGVNLSWTASTDNVGVTGYLIERCQGSGCSNFAQIATTTSTSYSDTGLTASTSYSYRVRATDAAGNLSSYSNIVSATTGATAVDTTAPTAPTNLTSAAISGTQIKLAWTASTDNVGVTGYLIERCQGSGCGNFAQVATATATNYNDTGLLASTFYSYRVRATDAAGNLSGYSNTTTSSTLSPDTTPPSAPTNLAATAAGSAQINLSWTASTDNVGVTGYLIERCQGAGCTTFAQIATTATTTYSNTGLLANTSYSYRVRAIDAAGNFSGYSNTASATTAASTGLVAAYGFEEGSGTTVADSSGNGNTGTISNATWTASGKYGKALVFNGTNARINVPDSASLHLSSGMTLEAWVSPAATVNGWRDLIYKQTDIYYLEGGSDSGVPAIGGTFAGVNDNLFATSPLAVNTWTHVAATYDGSTLRIYINGTQVGSKARTGAITSSTGALSIGGDPVFGQYFSGIIDEVRIYNRALSQAEIQTDMNTPIFGG